MNADGHASGGPEAPVPELHSLGVPVEQQRLTLLRHQLARWATRTPLGEEQAQAVVLATYEALANACLHAYPEGGGVVELHAACDPAGVRVTVTDHGRWRTPTAARNELGGRGLVLIRSLADHAEVAADARGTQVRMVWDLEPTAAR